MTDFNNAGLTPNSPLTCDYDNPSNNINQTPQIFQNNITPEEDKNSGEYIIYRSPYDSVYFIILSSIIFCIIFCIVIIIISFIFFYSYISYISLLIPIFGFIMGSCIDSDFYIIYDSSKKRLILKIKNIFKIIKKRQIIKINDIQNVIFKKYNNESQHMFNVNFMLVNGKHITTFYIFDKGGEYIKTFQSLKNVLPEEICFEEIGTY